MASKRLSDRPAARGVEEVGLPPVPLERLRPVVKLSGWETLGAALDESRDALVGRTVWMVNSSAMGGGVAELLRTFVPYWLGAGLDVRWAVVRGRPDFFRITKRVHNMLHGHPGDGGELGTTERRVYERALEPALAWLERRVRVGDIVVLHDPQTAGLAPALRAAGTRVVCRSHVGADHADVLVRAAWGFLRPYTARANALVFTRWSDVLPQLGAARVAVIHPSIDPCSLKNRPMGGGDAHALLVGAGLVEADGGSCMAQRRRHDGPSARTCAIRRTGRAPRLGVDRLVVHLARWDRLKDPLGVMESFATSVLDRADARLILAGPAEHAVADDPEAAAVYREVEQGWQRLPHAERDRIDLVRLSMRDLHENAAVVNALQREASVIVKKSLEEGFGLGVTEGMWKRRPVVASRVGGHRDQIEDGVSGVLVDDARDIAGFGRAIVEVLQDAERAQRLGDAAHERVRARFLPDQHMASWMRLLAMLS
jgi:trehalose synthase